MDRGLLDKVKLALLAMQRYAWEQGVAAQAFLEMGETELVVLLAKEALHRQREDGRLAVMGANDAVTDPAANGEAVLYAAQVTGDPALRAGAERMLEYLLHLAPRAADGTLLHISDEDRPYVMIDSIYMAPPFLAAAGEYDEALRQVEGLRATIYDPQIRVYRAAWDTRRKAWARAAAWGGGNGWVAAGIARVIGLLPPDMTEARARLAGYAREVIDGCLSYQRPDGLFHDVVDDPSTFVETNLAQMLAYGIYRGLGDGWLAETYRVAADRMRAAANAKVDQWGLVQGVASAPGFDRPGVSPEGQAFCLLMETAAARSLE